MVLKNTFFLFENDNLKLTLRNLRSQENCLRTASWKLKAVGFLRVGRSCSVEDRRRQSP